MATTTDTRDLLRESEGFLVESAEGTLGHVEEVWLDEADVPLAIALRTGEGTRALLLADDVVAVQREQGWVVAPSRPALLELEPPRVSSAADGDDRIAASWRTTGALVEAAPVPGWRVPLPVRALRQRGERPERPLWRSILLLYAFLAFAVALVTTLSFVIAGLVGGAAY